ncbi:unnamed protein product [Oreochromis niloticus]|nr:unnamed protein product [Mustela putorius furo]
MDCLLISGYGFGKTRLGLAECLSSKMDDSAAREDACREYQSSLEDLTFNSKPHINMLTILAEENINFAKDIVEIIEAQISKVDENTRKSLFKLRSTWDDVFPPKKLYALDVKVNSVDPAWPIKPLPPTINASIHVNPKFLKQPEESSSSPRPTPAQPPPTPPPAPQPVPAAISQSSLTQEQLIRQQLLAKQKQLLELQQKKIELELEQTKAQLASGFTLPAATAVSTSSAASLAPKLISQPAPVVRPWVPSQSDSKASVRDPRLNRPPTGPPPVDQPATTKREPPPTTGSHSLALEKARMQKKDAPQEKPKSKSPSPMAKSGPSKTKAAEAVLQSKDGTKKDPRLRKRTQDKLGEGKDSEQKEKKRCSDEKEREDAARGAEPQRFKGKLVNGSVAKHERDKASDKTAGNARTHARKRTRSRSRSRSPAGSPKRKDRRSPKGRARSSSPSPLHKAGKPRRLELLHGKPSREDRPTPKNQSESRRSKRPGEERHSETRDSHSPRSHEGGCKEVKDAPHRWRSGWEESKHMKLSDDMHAKPTPQRHKLYSTPNRPSIPRTPKHRLSVDANLQIPDVLNSASKKDLLRRASKRMESGEISREEFLNMAHQIKQLYQYQEEIQQRKDSWDESDFPVKKQPPLLSTPSSQPRPHEGMDAAELSYYEHKSKLRKTQVNHRPAGEEWEGEENPETSDKPGHSEKMGGGQSAGHPPPHKYNRAPRDRPGERRSKECEEQRAPLAPMVEEYNHGKEFPALKPGLRFMKRDHRETSEREWTSPLTERQHYNDREEQKSSYNVPRRYGPPADPRRPEVPPPSGTVVHRNSPSPAGLDATATRFERERLSPLQKDSADMSPIPRFESPNSEHSDDGPLDAPPPHASTKSILKAPHALGVPQSSVRQHGGSPGHTPPHDGGHPPARYNGPGHMGSSRPHPPGWYEGGGGPGRFDDSLQCEGPHHPAPGRFEGAGPPHQTMAERVDGPGHMSHGPMRGGERMGRFEGPPQVPGRFGAPVGLQTRFEVPGPGHSEGPLQRFEAPRHLNNMGPGPGSAPMGFQQRPARFEGPMRIDGTGHFEGPGQPGPRYDVPHQGGPPRFEHFPGQGHLRFEPQHNLQPLMRQMGPPMYESPMAPQQNFHMPPQRFPDPINPQFPAAPAGFPAQQNMQQAGNFHAQPFSQPGPTPFYNPAAPAIGLQQPVSVMGTMAQPFLPQTTVPFGQQNPQVVPAENHLGQVDVNDLLSKLLSTGIIKPSQPDATPASSSESSSAPPPALPPEEEEEEEQEVEGEGEDDVPDLTSFSIDDMKQRYESVVTKLYSGNQCCLCSMRFTATQTDMYADHLDWHFRQNHAGKVASKKVTHRRWYYSLTDWIEFEEIADLEERAKSQFFEKENEEEVQKSQAAAKEKEFQSVRATKDQVGESCEICQEPFETYWVEEEEDWFLKNAIKVDDKNFHPSCFEDYKNTSSYVDVTPSPSKLLTDHPLGAFVKTEEKQEEVASCAVAAAAAAAAAATTSVKQEVQSESGEPPEVKTEAGEEAAAP